MMGTEKPNTCNEPGDEAPTQSYEAMDWGLAIFLVLGVVALLLPHISIPFIGVYWAAVLSVVVFVVWFNVMQTTCMSGGFICSLVALAVLFNTLGIVLAAVSRFIIRLFTGPYYRPGNDFGVHISKFGDYDVLGVLNLGPWEHIYYYELDGRWRKRILVKRTES